MRQLAVILIFLSVCLWACTAQKMKKTTKRFNMEVKQLAEWMTGSFNSYQQAITNDAFYNTTLEVHPIWQERTDGHWLYIEQALANQQHQPYRQRIYQLKSLGKGKYEMVVYKIPQPERLINQWDNTIIFEQLSPEVLELRDGCSLFMHLENGVFKGETVEGSCESHLRGAAYATSKVMVYKDSLKFIDKGFDKNGQLLWGDNDQAYVLKKQKTEKLDYPKAKRIKVVDNYHGVEVNDPYRWLENAHSTDTKRWVEEQNELTDAYLGNIAFNSRIEARLKNFWNYPKYGVPRKLEDYYYFYKNEGLQNQNVLYQQRGFKGMPEVFLDPNTFSLDGTVSLSTTAFSKNGKHFAYGVSKSGSDWQEFFVMNVETKQKLPDHLKHIKFSTIAWFKDGFFYGRYDAPKQGQELSSENQFPKIYYHRLNTSQEKDELIYQNIDNPKQTFNTQTIDNERTLLLYAWEGAGQGNSLAYAKTNHLDAGFKPIINDFKSNNQVIDQWRGKLLMLTNRNAPKYRLVLVDMYRPEEENWIEVIPEQKHTLQNVTFAATKLVAHYMKDVSSHLVIYSPSGRKEGEIPLPGIGRVQSFVGNKDDIVAFYKFESFLYPPTIFKYNFQTKLSTVFQKSSIDFDFDNYETQQVFYSSKDGTKIPMFITHKKNLKYNGKNPTLLYAYGGFNISRVPEFKIENLPFYESGGIYVVANLRGGGEYGEEWHQAGILERKQNVFDDFIAASEYLIEKGYTSPEKLAATGHSNGGLLIGAVMNQRPDLYKVALPVVGVMDMLRYQHFTIGWSWVHEYGSSENPYDFDYLYRYSPYHNIRPNLPYPATFILTAAYDDRVVPAHSYKFAAQLQHNYQGKHPILIRVEQKAGHGRGKTTQQNIEKYTERWAFVFKHLGMFPK